MIIIVVVTFVAGVSSISWSADKRLKQNKTRVTTPTAPTTPTNQTISPQVSTQNVAKVIRKCPPGWHVDVISTFTWSCKPDKITFWQCPEGYNWRWAGECQGNCESVDIPK